MSKLALSLAFLASTTCVLGQAPTLNNKTAPPAADEPAPSQAADTPQASSMKVDAKLVVVPVAVRDNKGKLITDLKQQDFSLKVGDLQETIRYFDKDNDQPLTLGLLVDVSHSQQQVLPEEKKASQAFLDSMLQAKTATREADKAFIVHFAHDIELLQDVTDNPTRLQKAVRELGSESSTFHTTDRTGTDSEGRRVHNGGTSLYDALYLASDEIMSKQKGRKALIVLTDGVDNGSKNSLTEALEAAQRADVSVYAIYFKGQEPQQDRGVQHRGGWPGNGGGSGYPGGYPNRYPGTGTPGSTPSDPQDPTNPRNPNNPNYPGPQHKPNVDGKQVLTRLTEETGGHMTEVSKKQTVDDIYKDIGDELRSQYRIGFTPADKAAREGYHQIDLRVTGDDTKGKKVDVSCRDGYYLGS